jgi:CoA:oxalate CoA-transferase
MVEIKPGPLSGITVLDFTWVLAGPHATKHLRDLGADVLKVEMYKKGGAERAFPFRVDHEGVTQSSYSINVNRGKSSLCVNLKHAKGMEIIRSLIEKSDVLVENFAPGVMERLRLDYESVQKIRKDIIYCSISCFGHWGPYSHKPGYDIIAQSASGWIAQTDPATQAPVSIGDMNASMHALTAILAAIIHRNKSGEGQNIDISMVDCLFSLHENTLPWYLISSAVGNPVEPARIGRHHAGYAPYGVYNGKNGSIAIALLTDLRWEALLDLLGSHGQPLRNDPRFATVATRCTRENCGHVHTAVENWVMAQDSVEDAEKKLDGAGIPCMRVKGVVELADTDPQAKARDMMPTIEQPFIGPMRMYGSPLKFSKTPAGPRGHAPLLGEHNAEVLSKMLGYSEEKITQLYRDDVLFHEDAVNRMKK